MSWMNGWSDRWTMSQMYWSIAAGSCGDGWDRWLFYNNFCYFVGDGSGDGALTWRQARHFCQENGGELASITSMREEYFVWNLVRINISLQ